MHQLVLEKWSRGAGPLHARDARAKILVLLCYLAALGTTGVMTLKASAAYGALAMASLLAARLPIGAVLWRAAVVLPFSAVFAGASLLVGEQERAWAILVRSYFSATAVLVLVGTTPLPALLRGLEGLGMPRYLVLVVQFLYRYLLVLSEQAQHGRLAATSRGAARAGWLPDRLGLRASASALAVLFHRTQLRAAAIHRAMVARGFQGTLPVLSAGAFRLADAAFLAGGAALCGGVRLALAMVG